ncbi:MAG: hypothetical protein BGO39_04985 [Chloroflexi bacterium 54-19]|nr:MAG: hypothetical protein BGO39_04985 [Chloroflexi bacterium 54-19]
MAELEMTATINVANLDEVKEEIDRLKKRADAYENGLQCLKGYLQQLPGTGIIQQMIKVWFADARQETQE